MPLSGSLTPMCVRASPGIAALIVVIVFAFGGVLKNIFGSTFNSVGMSSGQIC
jgi:hypothetical protein